MSRHPGGAVFRRTVLLGLGLLLAFPVEAAERGLRNHLLLIQQLYRASDYERALAQVQVARQEPHVTDEDVTLSLYEGILLCELRQREEGRAAFHTAFLLKPEAKLPERVSPKIEAEAEAARQQVKRELAAHPPPVASKPAPGDPSAAAFTPGLKDAPVPSGARRYALIPALAGGTLVVAGGASWGISRYQLHRLRTDASLQTREQLQQVATRGERWQTASVPLLAAGAAGLITAAGMYWWGAPEQPTVSLLLGPAGAGAFVQGRWP